MSDREPGIRLLFGELLPEAELLAPDDLVTRMSLGQRPDACVLDATQLLELPPILRRRVLGVPRVLVCTGRLLASLPPTLLAGPGVAILAKPFCVEDLETAVEWIRGAPSELPPEGVPFGALVQRRRRRNPVRRLPAR